MSLKKKPVIFIGIIAFTVSFLFVFMTWLNTETSISQVQVSGKITHNPNAVSRFIGFNSHVGTTTVKIESDSYFVNLPNDQTYSVDVWYDYKNPSNMQNFTYLSNATRTNEAACNAGIFDLHSLSNQLEYDVTCPRVD